MAAYDAIRFDPHAQYLVRWENYGDGMLARILTLPMLADLLMRDLRADTDRIIEIRPATAEDTRNVRRLR